MLSKTHSLQMSSYLCLSPLCIPYKLCLSHFLSLLSHIQAHQSSVSLSAPLPGSLSFSPSLSLPSWLFQAHARSALTDCLNVTPASSSLWCYLLWVIAGHQAACVCLESQSPNALQLSTHPVSLKTNIYMNCLTSFVFTCTQETRLLEETKLSGRVGACIKMHPNNLVVLTPVFTCNRLVTRYVP